MPRRKPTKEEIASGTARAVPARRGCPLKPSPPSLFATASEIPSPCPQKMMSSAYQCPNLPRRISKFSAMFRLPNLLSGMQYGPAAIHFRIGDDPARALQTLPRHSRFGPFRFGATESRAPLRNQPESAL
jgi:hypothetical protein